MKGGYVLCEIGESAEKLDVIIVSTGTEVHICVEAAKIIAEDGLLVRVVSLPSWEIFLKNDAEYKKSVFIPGVPVVSVEALSTFGWSKFAHMSIGIDTFGESGKYADLYKHFGLVPEEIAKKVKHVAKVYKNKSAEIKLGVNHCC